MKKLILSLILLLFWNYGISQQLNSENIFRYVSIPPYGKIELGNNISQFKSYVELKDGHYFLKEKYFGGAKSIELLKNQKGKIVAMIFEYDKNVKLESQISDYSYLGKPFFVEKIATWNDGKTRFELFEENETVFSRISNVLNE